ncbi:hypothetical protein R3P38DRAFT_2861009 [Favolaschia claudopus]|uniref:MYND-type domain-containing protein n=1 Tax=Favolaschia claudopus TaxID=2862362 RepID=A0AAW0DQ84_9AGAR
MPGPGFGWEGIMGVGGGTVSKESQANLKRGQDLLRQKKPKQAMPYFLRALDQDPNNLDACASFALGFPPDVAIEFLKQAELKGRQNLRSILSPDCFELTTKYGAPHFWGILETRPYMRLLGTLVRCYVNTKKWEEAVTNNIEMLRICQSDNMGQRAWMPALLLQAGRPADALYFAQRWLETDDTPEGSGIDFAEPRRTPMTDAEIAKIKRLLDLQMIYSAALAAFMLDGDTPLAHQYLHIASKFPTVLIKVLLRYKERLDLDTHPTRSMNGPEDARDHLWLAQDLWMQDAVWNWVDRDPFIKDKVLRECGNTACKKKEEKVGQWRHCSGCKRQWYCSRECQKAHWSDHKKPCKEIQQMESMSAMWQ